MNILFLTQNKTLELFYNTMLSIDDQTSIDKVGFYVADSSFYVSFIKSNPEIITSDSIKILKEWDILEKAANTKPDIKRLKAYEKKIGDPCLWNILVSDRRIYLGKKASLEQDYKPRFNYDNMLSILQTGLVEMERLFDVVKPDLVVSFICVTLGDYLGYLIARERRIPFINLRPTRIKNYFFAGEDIFEPSERLARTYKNILSSKETNDVYHKAVSHLKTVRRTHAMYEGVIPARKSLNKSTGKTNTESVVSKLGRKLKKLYYYQIGDFRYDTHYRGELYQFLFKRIKSPLRVRTLKQALAKQYITEKDLSLMEYVFYPLHKEPEVTLLVYSRPYLNQIEAVRNIARNLPVGMKLVIKEHPASVGYRPLSYYQKLLAIPNVVLVAPELESRRVIQHAALVSIICGSVGLEAVMMKKPVVVLGHAPFNFLPDSMVTYCKNLDNLGIDIFELLENHHHDEDALIAYISAVISLSVPVDFYSRLLGRTGVFRDEKDLGKRNEAQIWKDQMNRMAGYLIETHHTIASGNTRYTA